MNFLVLSVKVLLFYPCDIGWHEQTDFVLDERSLI